MGLQCYALDLPDEPGTLCTCINLHLSHELILTAVLGSPVIGTKMRRVFE